MPHIVLTLDMFFKANSFIIKSRSIESCIKILIGKNIYIYSKQYSGVIFYLTMYILLYIPQMKQVFFKISSFCCFSLLKSANVSIMTPKIKFKTIMITMKKNNKSYITLATNRPS